jgi:diguanylate cyclase (GGDEF)-like protein
MTETTLTKQRLLPTVSIVEETMRQALRAVAVALAGTAVLTAVLFGERLWFTTELERAAHRSATANRLVGEITLVEQQLEQAAQTAAQSGDPAWIERYDKLIATLQQRIDHVILLVPMNVARNYRDKTATAGSDIAKMRASALEALRSAALPSARTLFESERYTGQVRLLTEATAELAATSIVATEREMKALHTRSYTVAGAALGLAMVVGFALWRRLSNGLNQSRGSLLDAEVRVQRLAASDMLTGLDNRAALHDAMQTRMARAKQHNQELAVLMVDLDRFKPVNDRNGHMVGDLVLKEVARRLGRCLRQADLRARYGGDEFVVVIDEADGTRTPRSAAERIIEMLSEPMYFGDLTVNIGASVGIARYPRDASSDDELMRKADSALYRAKKTEAGSICLYDPKLDEAMSERAALEQELREGIAAGQLVPFYQPIVNLERRQVMSLELLCRWRHPSRGLLSPDKFISLAEDSGLIGPLTLSLLHQACRDMLRFPAHWRLSFNVAPQQIQDETLVPQLLQVLRENGVPPHRLDVELTETALVNDTARARDVILSLKRAGMTVTLDDFGTGYSSLSYLAEMTFDKIKIDRSFVRTLRDRPESTKIVDAILGLSRSLGVDTVAEGVETEEEARLLHKLGCKNGQGYLFGRPVRAQDLRERIALAADQVPPPPAAPSATPGRSLDLQF